MTTKTTHAARFSSHAICVATGVRDGMRTAHYYVRDLHHTNEMKNNTAWLSRYSAQPIKASAKVLDRALTRGGNLAISLLLPNWRKLPSPFAAETTSEIVNAIKQDRLFQSPLFNTYFFRSCKVLLAHWATPPNLVLEHQIDTARRTLATAPTSLDQTTLLAKVLIALMDSAPIARHGAVRPGNYHIGPANIELAVCASACLALLLAQRGSEINGIGDKEFLSIVGALIAPRLDAIKKACLARDLGQLTTEFEAICDLY